VAASDARAQRIPGADAPLPRTVEGRVVLGSARRQPGVAGQTVVLHRIASDSAGSLDSARTSRDGRFRFAYTAAGEALYIVSTRFAGIAYFTPPLRATDVRRGGADIVVFDTTTSDIVLAVRGRHFIVAAPDENGVRRVVEVFEIANDTSLTRIAGPGGAPSWSVRLPGGATSARAGQSDVPAEAVRFEGGDAQVFAPFPPGLKQIVFSYELPRGAFPLGIPASAPAGTLEVLLEEEAAAATGGGLVRQEPVRLEGRGYQRYLAQDVPANAALRLAVPETRRSGRTLPTLIVTMAGVLFALGAVTGRRRAPAPPPASGRGPVTVAEPVPDAESLASAIAALDTVLESLPDPGDGARAAYAARRTELKDRLLASLAAVEGRGSTR